MVDSGYDANVAGLNRRRKIAEAIAGQSISGPSPTQMVGSGPYQVAVPNYTEGIGKIAQALIGQNQLAKLDTEEKQLKADRRAEIAKAMTTYWPALQDPNSTPEARQTAAASLAGTIEPEDMRAVSAQLLKSSLDPKDVQARRVAQVDRDIAQAWRGKPPARAVQTGGSPGQAQAPGQDQMPELLQTGGMGQERPVAEVPDTESPEYYQFVAQGYEQAGLPQEAEKARREAEKRAKESRKEAATQRSENWKTTSGLRDDFRQDTKPMFEVRDSYARVVKAAENPSAAGDIALIFNYMKMLDPGSVVREGEFATAQNAGSLPQNIVAAYNKLLTGERLVPAVRADFVDRAGKMYDALDENHAQVVQRYRDVATRFGVNPDDVIRPMVRPGAKAQPKAAAKPAAAPGAPAGAPKADETKVIGGKTYIRRGADWFEVEK